MPEDKKSQELIIAANNKPYQNEKAAWSAFSQKGLDSKEWEVVPYEKEFHGEVLKGFAIAKKPTEPSEEPTITTNNNEPNQQNEPNEQLVSEEGANQYPVYAREHSKAEKKTKIEPFYEEYWWVIFSERGDLINTEDVELHHNGQTLVFMRGVESICPKSFLIVADGTRYPVNVNVPHSDRKETVWKQSYAYTKKRPSTREEFEAKRKQWTRETIDEILTRGSRGSKNWNIA